MQYSAAVLASLPAERRFYQRLLQQLDWPLYFVGDAASLLDKDPLVPTFWIAHLQDEQEQPDWLYEHPCVIFFEGPLPDLDSTEGRRLSKKLLQSLAAHAVLPSPEAYPDAPLPVLLPTQIAKSADDVRQLWVILASTGGPQPVRQFLSRLPSGLPMSFLYAQHIEASGWNALLALLEKNSQLQVQALRGQQSLRAGRLYLLPTNQQIHWQSQQQVSSVKEPWLPPYAPNFNQLLASCAPLFQQRLGVLVFSGMDADGAESAELVAQTGGQIWTQALSSCQQPSMPEAFNRQTVVSRMGSPFQLARWLVEQTPQEERS